MTVPSCSNDVRRCSPEDRRVFDAASEDNQARAGAKLPAHVTPNGPTRREVKRQSGTATAEAADLAKRYGQNVYEDSFKGNPGESLAEKIASRFGPGRVYGAVKKISEAHQLIVAQARQIGAQLDEATRRDAMNVFILDVTAASLDKGYVTAQQSEREGSRELADGISRRVVALPAPQFTALLQGLTKSTREGVAMARSLGITSREQLDRALQNNPEFARRHDAETAFRHGVESVLFAARREANRS